MIANQRNTWRPFVLQQPAGETGSGLSQGAPCMLCSCCRLLRSGLEATSSTRGMGAGLISMVANNPIANNLSEGGLQAASE